MATLSNSESRRLYSWWWDSHISPKNSKWLHENLTDMDAKVKTMIKLIEEDADSFAKRAEMYYKKRPELMRLVEDFYRAYRALAERYDHATGALRQAQRTMAEAFPNQVPFVLADDSPSGSSVSIAEPHTSETLHPVRAMLDPDDLQKDALGLSSSQIHSAKRNGAYSNKSDQVTSQKGLKQLNELFGSGEVASHHGKFAEGKVQKGLAYHDDDRNCSEHEMHMGSKDQSNHLMKEKELTLQVGISNQNLKTRLKSSFGRAGTFKTEVQTLKDSPANVEAFAKLDEEKEAAALPYQKSLETISYLQSEVSHAQEEARRLSSVIVMGVAKLSSTEEQYIQLERENQSLQTEVDTLIHMTTIQKQELSEKHEELKRLQEYIHSMEDEDTLHSECQEEQGALTLEVQNAAQRLKDKEVEYQSLEEERWLVKEENKILNEHILSLALVEKDLQDEIFTLREAEVKLDKEVKVLVDQRNALQQEIYCLKKEIDDLKKQHLNVMEQMELVGLKPDCLGSSVKSLRDENLMLKDICQKDNNEKESLLETLKNMENILVKNSFLENTLSDVNAGLELLREKVRSLEETCQSLKRENSIVINEKESVISHMKISNRIVEKLLKKNTFLENVLFDANVERVWLREKSKSLEEFCQFLDNEKYDLFTANGNLVTQLESIQQKWDGLGRKHGDLEKNHSGLKKEMESRVHQVEELQATLNLGTQEHASFRHSSEAELTRLEGNNHTLQEEVKRRTKEFEDEQDKAVKFQLEIFIFQRYIQDVKKMSLSLFVEYQKHLETSKLSENRVTTLERENFEKQVKVNSLLDQVEKVRFGIRQMALLLEINPVYKCQVQMEEDQILLQLAMRKIDNLESSLWSIQDEKHQLQFENSVFLTLLGQLRLEAASIESDRSSLDRDLKLRTEDLLLLQSERNILKSASDYLNHQVGIGKDILSQKEVQLSETEQKLKAMESENIELYSKLKDMNRGSHEAGLTRVALENQILDISENNTCKNKEIGCLHEATGKLELELQQKKNEIELWEDEAETLYLNWQVTDIHAALFKENAHQLAGACESLEDARDSKTEDIEQLKQRLHTLDLENKGVKSELAAYLPVIVSLRDSVTSLEDHVILKSKNHVADNEETEVAYLASHQHENTNEELTEKQSLVARDGVSDLLELQIRIKSIGSSVVEQQRLIMQESFDCNIKLEAAMNEIQKLEQVGYDCSNRKLHNGEPDFSEIGNDILVKDIPLDQVSHCSSYDHGFVPHAMSRRHDAERHKDILEVWEIVEEGFDHDLTFNQQQKLDGVPTQEESDIHQTEPVEEKSECPSSEIQSEEFKVVSKRGTVHQEGDKKILERLASDAQKLMNLQVTVQDLKNKVEQLEKRKTPNDTEFKTVKGQLNEVEEAVMQLVGTNGKLSERAEGQPVESEGKVTLDLEDKGKSRRERISERARRASEKIGRLQLEVQRMQFVLLRIENRYKSKGTKVTDRKVLLKDYLYGNLRSPPKRKKRLFCSCTEPLTKLD